jgi:hypothetical protein
LFSTAIKILSLIHGIYYIFLQRVFNIVFPYHILKMKRLIKLQWVTHTHFHSLTAGLAAIIVFVLFFRSDANAQADYATNPVWIKMMDDSTTNYYEAIKAYNEYWKNHVKPAGEEGEMAEGEKDAGERAREAKREMKKDRKRVLSEDDLKKMNENNLMKYQVKRFEQWAREVKPFVQEDGRILSQHERMEIWNKQQEEIKQQQK